MKFLCSNKCMSLLKMHFKSNSTHSDWLRVLVVQSHLRSPVGRKYCQAEVQLKSSLTTNSKSKLLTPNSNSRLDWRDTIIEQPTPPDSPILDQIARSCHPPTLNFLGTSRCLITKCYTFLETSHVPQLGSPLRCKNFANFFATLFCKPLLSLLENLPTSVFMNPNLDHNLQGVP